MYAEYLIVDDNTEREEVKHVGEVVPDISIAVLPRTLGVKAVGLRNSSRLVVASNQMDAVGVSQF